MGGNEVLEGILLGPLCLSMARRQVSALQHGTFLDPDEVEFLCTAMIRYLEAVNALAPNRSRRSAP